MSRDKLVNEIDAELKKHPGVVALLNEQTGQVATFVVPRPYWQANDAGDTGTLTDSELKALERERDSLIAALPTLKKAARSKATTRINIIEGTLRRARANEESDRVNREREAERPVQRYGQPGNASTAANFASMSMADQTDVIQAAIKELRRVGAA